MRRLTARTSQIGEQLHGRPGPEQVNVPLRDHTRGRPTAFLLVAHCRSAGISPAFPQIQHWPERRSRASTPPLLVPCGRDGGARTNFRSAFAKQDRHDARSLRPELAGADVGMLPPRCGCAGTSGVTADSGSPLAAGARRVGFRSVPPRSRATRRHQPRFPRRRAPAGRRGPRAVGCSARAGGGSGPMRERPGPRRDGVTAGEYESEQVVLELEVCERPGLGAGAVGQDSQRGERPAAAQAVERLGPYGRRQPSTDAAARRRRASAPRRRRWLPGRRPRHHPGGPPPRPAPQPSIAAAWSSTWR